MPSKAKKLKTPIKLEKKKTTATTNDDNKDNKRKTPKQLVTKEVVSSTTKKVSNETPKQLEKESAPLPSSSSPPLSKTYVSTNKLQEAIETLKKVVAVRNNEALKKDKLPLIDDQSDSRFVHLQINYKKINLNKSIYIQSISLPNHWRHETACETCLIVDDVNKERLKDRDLDLDTTKQHYRDLLDASNVGELISEILPRRELSTEYTIPEAKQRLCRGFDTFLCDRKLMQNKFDFLPQFLGKTFWIDYKKVPLPVDLKSTTLRADLEAKLNQTHLYVTGFGDTHCITIGLVNQSTDQLLANLVAVLEFVSQKFGNNIRSLSIKTDKSMAITFYLDCGLISDIYLERKHSDQSPIEDDFSHFLNAKLKVFRSGDVKVVANDDGVDDDDAMDEDMVAEKQFLAITEKDDKRKKAFKEKMKNNKTLNNRHKRKTFKLNAKKNRPVKRRLGTKSNDNNNTNDSNNNNNE
ncbi:uncharacterized protein LOC128961043 [Oppia nitens]|uniref:uncharacterized protein LOC128961043 n=1 Tax=Oppia nitens TaxID=1686743 RepID=UPI0023D9F133|nr:uncharacterized protein LOC128961043 [Oppia nitens]